MFIGGGFGVGLTVAALDLPVELAPGERPAWLSEVLPVEGRSAADKARELRRVQQLKARLAAYEVDLVAGLAADRPDTADRRPGRPGAAADRDDLPGPGAPEGVSEFFADELALILNCSRAEASVQADAAATLTARLPGTRAALADGGLDWPRARAIAAELGWPARDTDPAILAAVEAAVLPVAADLSITRLRALVRRELTARDADAAERRRRQAERGANVTARPVGDGMGELTARMPWPLAAACREQVEVLARAAKAAGDPRPIGLIRAGVLADLIQHPWDEDRPAVTAQLVITAPLDALSPAGFLAAGAPPPHAFTRPGAVPAPTGAVNGAPITADQLAELLTQLDAVCPGGLLAPSGGSLQIALTDPDGTLRAVLDRRQLAGLVARGCPTHPGTGCGCAVLDAPPPTAAYAPTPGQRVFVQTRDRTCRHPGCVHRAGWADLDHVVPHRCGGETACENLCCLCRRHHRIKTFAPGWLYAMTPDGVLTVTTPSGVTRTSRPPGQLDARGGEQRGSADPARAPDRGPGGALPVTGPRVLARPPDPPPAAPDPADDPPPF